MIINVVTHRHHSMLYIAYTTVVCFHNWNVVCIMDDCMTSLGGGFQLCSNSTVSGTLSEMYDVFINRDLSSASG